MDEHLAIIGHDLRSELHSISALTQLIDLLGAHPEVQGFTEQIRNHTQFMYDMVDGLVVRAKSEGIEPTLTQVSVWNLVADVARGLAIHNRATPIVITAIGRIPDALISDSILLRQILTNVMGNAVRFTSEGGIRTYVEYLCASRQLRIRIADTGAGMSPEQLAQVFCPDLQLHRQGAKPGGHGLGLWIARFLVGRLSGTITVHSLSGHGTHIEVIIPAETGPQARMCTEAELRQSMPQNQLSGSLKDQGSFAGLRFLVADDVSANRLLAATLLKHRSASVTLAEDGFEAVQMARLAQQGHRPYDLMLFDFHMPNMDGLEAAECLRQEDCTAPILLWTSMISLRPDQCLDAFTAVLKKPCDSEHFYKMITKYLHPPEVEG
jgi:CheY-like chemotaxis protein/anti-sigma regulatory factor (Ser/Thr protein kinase)